MEFVIGPPKEVFKAAPNEDGAATVLLVLASNVLFSLHERVWGPVKIVVIAVIGGELL